MVARCNPLQSRSGACPRARDGDAPATYPARISRSAAKTTNDHDVIGSPLSESASRLRQRVWKTERHVEALQDRRHQIYCTHGKLWKSHARGDRDLHVFRNKTPVPGAIFGDFPGPEEVRARTRGQSEIAGARRVEQLQQLARCVGHVRLPHAGRHFGARSRLSRMRLLTVLAPSW